VKTALKSVNICGSRCICGDS